jgi:hypothetical protein
MLAKEWNVRFLLPTVDKNANILKDQTIAKAGFRPSFFRCSMHSAE